MNALNKLIDIGIDAGLFIAAGLAWLQFLAFAVIGISIASIVITAVIG